MVSPGRSATDPARQPLLPKWVVYAALVTGPLAIVGVIFARLSASMTPNPATGQVYEIFFAKSQSYWYLDLWHLVIYRALTVPAICAWLFAGGLILYALSKKIWRRR